jgi:hypothetical protein
MDIYMAAVVAVAVALIPILVLVETPVAAVVAVKAGLVVQVVLLEIHLQVFLHQQQGPQEQDHSLDQAAVAVALLLEPATVVMVALGVLAALLVAHQTCLLALVSLLFSFITVVLAVVLVVPTLAQPRKLHTVALSQKLRCAQRAE